MNQIETLLDDYYAAVVSNTRHVFHHGKSDNVHELATRAKLLQAIQDAIQAPVEADIPFDAAKVKPGDTIQAQRHGDEWIDVRYIGPWLTSPMSVVVQHDKHGFFAVETDLARMPPIEMITLYANVYANGDIMIHDDEPTAHSKFHKSLGGVAAHPVRVPKV